MKIAQNVASVLKDHVTLEVEGIDRMYLNVYQCELGIVRFFRVHRNQPWASSALMSPMSRQFVAAMERFAKDEALKWCSSEKDSEKTM